MWDICRTGKPGNACHFKAEIREGGLTIQDDSSACWGLNVSYEGTSTWEKPKNTGQFHGNKTEWTLSGVLNLQPEKVTGWQVVRLTLIPGGTKSDFQPYNLYIDPYVRR